MASNPRDTFFWKDWLSDPALRLCGPAARGFWMDCLCLCALAGRRGYLLVNGKRPSDAHLAKLTSTPEKDVPMLLAELEENGVLSRTRRGVVYCRRMVRTEKRTKTARENGKKGGNPTLCQHTDISSWDNPQVNLPPHARARVHSSTSTTKPHSKTPPDPPTGGNGGNGHSRSPPRRKRPTAWERQWEAFDEVFADEHEQNGSGEALAASAVPRLPVAGPKRH